MSKFYAVKNGRVNGIYESWEECKEQIYGFSNAVYKSFASYEDARAFMGYEVDDDGEVSDAYAYVDGSFCLDKLMYSYGVVFFHNGEIKEFKKAFDEPEMVSMRNVAGEVMGAWFVMEYCLENNIKSVDIYYDYAGIEKWCTGEWKTNKIGTQKYAEFYNNAKENLRVNFVKVKGHSGVLYNERADKLAKEALGITG